MTNSTTDELRPDWPDHRPAGLLDTAQAHLTDNEPDQAIAIWQELIRSGGEASDWGHLEYADYLLRLEKEDEANGELAALMVGRRIQGLPWLLTAKLLEETGRSEEALFWYSAGVGCLSPEKLDVPAQHRARELGEGRRRLKWELGIPLDKHDLLVEMGHRELDDKVFGMLVQLGHPEVDSGKLDYWERTELEQCFQIVDPPAPKSRADRYYRHVERILQASRCGRVVLVPRRAAWVFSVLAATSDIRTKQELSLISRFSADDEECVEWPPGRNQPCWCGSGVKYKKCCGLLGDTV